MVHGAPFVWCSSSVVVSRDISCVPSIVSKISFFFERGSKRTDAIKALSDALGRDGIRMRPEDVAQKVANLTMRVRRKLAMMERNNDIDIRFRSHEVIIAKMMQDAKSSSSS